MDDEGPVQEGASPPRVEAGDRPHSDVLKVSTRSSPNAVAGALAGVVRQRGSVDVQVVGAGALNQAVKAVAIARSFLHDSAIDLICIPNFADIEIGGEARTAIRLRVEDRGQATRPAGPADGLVQASIDPSLNGH